MDREFVRPGHNPQGIRVGIFGDSFLQGTGGPAEDSLAYCLIQELEKQGMVIRSAVMLTKDGATVDGINERIQDRFPVSNPDEEELELDPKQHFDLIVFNGGVNDHYRGFSNTIFQDALSKVIYPTLKRMLAPEGRIVKLNTIDWSTSPAGRQGEGHRHRCEKYQTVKAKNHGNKKYNTSQGVSQTLRTYNTIDEEIAKEKNAIYVKVSEHTFKYVINQATDQPRPECFLDGLHFSKSSMNIKLHLLDRR